MSEGSWRWRGWAGVSGGDSSAAFWRRMSLRRSGGKKEARPELTKGMLRGSGGRGMERERGEGRHVTKCILITEQQMSRMELLCCLNSRTLHFSGLTSHRIHLLASCQFRVERVKGGSRRESEREKEGREAHANSSLPQHVLREACRSLHSSPVGLHN